MRIKDTTISQVLAAVDIVEVVEDFLPLKKKGSNWWALSPFVNEKNASFAVSRSKGIFKCFSSGKSGDAVSFVMELEGLSFPETIRYLAKKYAIDIEEEQATPEQQAEYSERESLYIVLNFAKTFFREKLLNTDEGQAVGLSYFKERGFFNNTQEVFELGYSPAQWDALEKAATAKGYSALLLEKAGLVISKENRQYDRFRERVMFPIHNLSGRVIGFGARTLKKDGQPKYLNSPESPVYQKSQVLYGIFQAKKAIREQGNCYLVEGYTDVISLHQAGIHNVVASSGTSLTEGQISLIKRFSNTVTVLYDGDKAGIRAALRGTDMLLQQGLDVKAVLFPDGEDPDSFVRKTGGERFSAYLKEKAQDIILFKTGLFLEDAAKSPAEKAELIRGIVESIAKIPDPIKRAVFYKECSSLLGVEEDILLAEGNRLILDARRRRQKQEAQSHENDTPPPPGEENPTLLVSGSAAERHAVLQEKEFVRLLVNYGAMPDESGTCLFEHLLAEAAQLVFVSPIYSRIVALYREKSAFDGPPAPVFFTGLQDDGIKNEIVDMVTDRSEPSANWMKKFGIKVPGKDEDLANALYRNMLYFKFSNLERIYEEALEQLKAGTGVSETMEKQRLCHEIKKEMQHLAGQLGIVVR